MKKSWVLVGAVLAFAGCGKYLTWRTKPPATTVTGKLNIMVDDTRQKKGLVKDTRIVATEPGPYMIPIDKRLDTPTEAAESIRDMLGQAALSSGVGVAAVGEKGTANLMVELNGLHCTGHWPVFIASFAAGITLVDPTTMAVRMPTQAITVQGGAGDCQNAHKDALTKAYLEAEKLMGADGFKQAAAAVPAGTAAADPAAAPAPATPPPSSNSGW
jgi:hypothetical protein